MSKGLALLAVFNLVYVLSLVASILAMMLVMFYHLPVVWPFIVRGLVCVLFSLLFGSVVHGLFVQLMLVFTKKYWRVS